MRESSSYQAILEEGGVEVAQRIILRQGRQKLGASSDAVTAAVQAITDLARLERMSDRILTTSSWDELLAIT